MCILIGLILFLSAIIGLYGIRKTMIKKHKNEQNIDNHDLLKKMSPNSIYSWEYPVK